MTGLIGIIIAIYGFNVAIIAGVFSVFARRLLGRLYDGTASPIALLVADQGSERTTSAEWV